MRLPTNERCFLAEQMKLPVAKVFALHRSNTPRTCNRSVGKRSEFVITARALHALSFERQQHRVIGIETEAELNTSFHLAMSMCKVAVIAIHSVERETRCTFITFGGSFCIASGTPACMLEQLCNPLPNWLFHCLIHSCTSLQQRCTIYTQLGPSTPEVQLASQRIQGTNPGNEGVVTAYPADALPLAKGSIRSKLRQSNQCRS